MYAIFVFLTQLQNNIFHFSTILGLSSNLTDLYIFDSALEARVANLEETVNGMKNNVAWFFIFKFKPFKNR